MDSYRNKLQQLIDNLSDSIRLVEEDFYNNQQLFILILFCLRILIMRFTSQVLEDLFTNIWPMLLSLLFQAFDRSKNLKKTQPNLILAALKLLELLSIIQVNEFFIHQWLFVFDYFGVQFKELAQLPAHDLPFTKQPSDKPQPQ